MVHCSGGAQTKILHFIDNLHIVKNNLFPVPPLFQLIQEESKTDWKEMYQVFNCGHRMELYVPEAIAEDLIAISESFGVPAQVIGYVEVAMSKRSRRADDAAYRRQRYGRISMRKPCLQGQRPPEARGLFLIFVI